MGFFDFKTIIIILLILIVYLLYREIINIKNIVNYLFNKNNVTNSKIKNELKNNLIDELDNLENDIPPDKNKNFYSNCIVKTIKIPLNLETLLNPFETIYNNINNTHIIELSQDDIDNTHIIELSQDNIIKLSQDDIEEIISTSSQKKNNDFKNLETIHEEIPLNNDTSEYISDKKSNISSNHIEIYSNDDSHIEINNELNNEINNELNNEINNKINYKNILKNLNKYKLPELQDIAIQFKLSRENNNKKKTRLELIEEIKNYIINKNI
jgi:hypothetical protein